MTPTSPPAPCTHEGPSVARVGRTGRLAQVALGRVLACAGAAAVIRAALGACPWDSVAVGLADHVGITTGTANIAINLVFVLVGVALGDRPCWMTLAIVLADGPLLDGALAVIPEATTSAGAWGQLVGGLVLSAAGVAVYLEADRGRSAYDLVLLGIARRFRRAIGTTGLALDLTAFAVALLLGGPLGYGTLAVGVLGGPTLGLAVMALRRFVPRAAHRARREASEQLRASGAPEPRAVAARPAPRGGALGESTAA